ncbi:unnamed protein product, partial [Timema podura]|nr:unnamed protein product [Timema podura]
RDGSILADRLEKLDQARQGWKKRVEPTDAVKFSVAGKMGLENKVDTPPLATFSPADRKKRTPKQRSSSSYRNDERLKYLLQLSDKKWPPPHLHRKKSSPLLLYAAFQQPGGDENGEFVRLFD